MAVSNLESRTFAQPSKSSAAQSYYRPELDVLRLIAFLMVYFHHVIPRIPGNYHGISHIVAASLAAIGNACGFGLPLFFFLSAFLITKLLLLEDERTGKIHLASFYVRRWLRIWPLYVFGVLIGVSIAAATGAYDDLHMYLGWYTWFGGNFYFQHHAWTNSPMAPLWSISVEEQFYVVFPILLMFVRPKNSIWIGLAFMAASMVTLYAEGERHAPVDTVIWSNTLSQMIFFGAGIASASAAIVVPKRFRTAMIMGGFLMIKAPESACPLPYAQQI